MVTTHNAQKVADDWAGFLKNAIEEAKNKKKAGVKPPTGEEKKKLEKKYDVTFQQVIAQAKKNGAKVEAAQVS